MTISTTKGKVLSFGEVLLRMSPPPAGRWIEQAQMPVYIGGAETNVAAALALWGVPAKALTAVPQHYLGDDIIDHLARVGMDVSAVHRSGSRVGVYYLRQGSDLKHSSVVYDRAHSAFHELRLGMLDWDVILEDVGWFNFSAITPALNEHMPGLCLEALKAAREKGLTISVDLNYRARLWQWGKRPDEVMPELVEHCDVVMGNIWAANTLLDIPLDQKMEAPQNEEAYLRHAERTSREIMRQFPRCKMVANTFRFERKRAGLEYYSTLFTGGVQYTSPHFATAHVIDKVGSGDCFMAGLIYGLYNNHSPQQTVDFAAAAAFGKLGEEGDSTRQSIEAVHDVLNQRAG